MDRKYSVQELDTLRAAVKNKCIWGRYSGSVGNAVSRSFMRGEVDKSVEEMVRTHMMAGHTVQDLFDSEKELLS